MALIDNSKAYLVQYLQVATKGNVVCHFAILINRVQFKCNVCEMTLTANKPEGTEIDYQIQEFVKIHAHVGGHKDPHVHIWHALDSGDGFCCDCGAGHPDTLTPVTADFKKIPIGSGFHIDAAGADEPPPEKGALQKLMNNKSILETKKESSRPRGPKAKKLSQPTGRKFR